MEYSMVGITALIILLIINHDVIFKLSKNLTTSNKAYRLFVFALMTFFITDILWGVLYEQHIMTVLYADTVVYFVAMSLTIFFWARYVTIYISTKGFLHKVLYYIGLLLFLAIVGMLIINFFKPIMFEFKGNEYDANIGRYFVYFAQELMYFITALISMFEAINERRRANKNRFIVISLFSVAMAITIFFQMAYPLLPMYSMGCMIGICLIHSFVVESEKDENRKQITEMLAREIKHERELDKTKSLIYVDSLTGAQTKFAYAEMEDKIDKLIASNLIDEFAVVVFDVNGLKYINDTEGHEAGDRYLKECYKLITDVYKNDKIYRFGGDEFVVVLEDIDYVRRDELLLQFDCIIDKNLMQGLPVVSTGMSVFEKDVDNTYRAVFVRADEKMYNRKKFLKSRGSHAR